MVKPGGVRWATVIGMFTFRKEMKMKTIVLFETAGELVDAFYAVRSSGDSSPIIPDPIKLVSDVVGSVELVGEGSDRFHLADSIGLDEIIYVLAERAGVRLEMEME